MTINERQITIFILCRTYLNIASIWALYTSGIIKDFNFATTY